MDQDVYALWGKDKSTGDDGFLQFCPSHEMSGESSYWAVTRFISSASLYSSKNEALEEFKEAKRYKSDLRYIDIKSVKMVKLAISQLEIEDIKADET